MLEAISRWVDDCVRTHSFCAAYNAPDDFVPKRLIKLDGNARLVSPVAPVRYAALSYCWGLHKQPSTVKSNVAACYNSMDISNFPNALRDAILMTRKLGISFVWIDSICIVQDDENDWATEAARMADVYSNAHVVLAATRASGVSEGFLQSCTPSYNLSLHIDRKRSLEVQARRLWYHQDYYIAENLGNFPLSKRGWVLQERLLATRTVHFLPDELVFECKSRIICECGIARHPTNSTMTWPPTYGDAEKIPLASDVGFGRAWVSVVRSYSRLHLTYQSDLLPALSGIAQRTLSLRPGMYIAGIGYSPSSWQSLAGVDYDRHNVRL